MRRAGASLAGRLLSQVAREAFGCCRSAAAETLQPQSQQWWQAGAAHLQRAGVRTRHAPKPHHAAAARPRRGLLARSLTAVGKAAGLAAVGAPVAGVAALLVVSRGQADAAEVVGSLPRTARVVWWGAWATYKVRVLVAPPGSVLACPGIPCCPCAAAALLAATN